jgi:hypothetical protein
MTEPTPQDVDYVRIVLADAGLPATPEEVRLYAADRRAVLATLARMYEPPFDDRYVGPFLTPSLRP